MDNQRALILNHLQQGKSITPIEALEKFGCFRLGARIHELRQKGYDVQKSMEKKGKKVYAKYYLNTAGCNMLGKLQKLANISRDSDEFVRNVGQSSLEIEEVLLFLKREGFENLPEFYELYTQQGVENVS